MKCKVQEQKNVKQIKNSLYEFLGLCRKEDAYDFHDKWIAICGIAEMSYEKKDELYKHQFTRYMEILWEKLDLQTTGKNSLPVETT